ncbi:MAG: hypothetical protein H7256_08475 [Bdellovibrio sp.]|nr:hypothetical protein [Bdellovibrio sp.]
MNLAIIVGAFLVFIGAMVVYAFLMVYFPKWVGITGKSAFETIEGHKEGSQNNDKALANFVDEK